MSQGSKHIVVGMSGGVDSSVAALRLQQQGHRVSGLFMKNWEEDDDDTYCAAAQDLADAQAVCDKLDIPLHTINFSTEYWDRGFQEFLDECAAGRTPNPDVLCNREIKFKEFLEQAHKLGADGIATGHYANVGQTAYGLSLLRAADRDKDQSYFLYAIAQSALRQTTFPLAELHKSEVRKLAQRHGFVNAQKKDSTGICFIGERRFKDFLQRYLHPQPGEIRDLANNPIGQHDGLMYYTIGQRQGLGIGGAGDAWYVVAKDMAHNVLYVAQGHDHPALFSSWLRTETVHWIAAPPPLPLRCTAKTRYRQADQDCTVEALTANTLTIQFAQPQRAVTPGQAVVLYDGEVCLGGATILDCEALSAPALNARHG